MKTIFFCLYGSSFRTALVLIAICCTILTNQRSIAQSITIPGNTSVTEENYSNGLRVVVHPVANTLGMKVHFVNPDQENMVVIIKNSQRSVVYKKNIGEIPVFHGRFDLSTLPDDTYTVEVRSRKHTHSQSITLQTQQARVVQGL